MTGRRSTSGRFASVFVAALVAPTAAAANPAENDEAMIRAATRSGCMACHAIKYRDDPGASERLTRIVMTGSNPRAPHWTGKAGAVTMPPNATDVTEADARVFVNRILVLVLQRGGPEPETGFAESRAGVVYRSTRSAPKTR